MCHVDDKEVPGRELEGRELLKANTQSLWHYHHAPKCFCGHFSTTQHGVHTPGIFINGIWSRNYLFQDYLDFSSERTSQGN